MHGEEQQISSREEFSDYLSSMGESISKCSYQLGGEALGNNEPQSTPSRFRDKNEVEQLAIKQVLSKTHVSTRWALTHGALTYFQTLLMSYIIP